MKRTLLALCAILVITASRVWGGCSGPSCSDNSPSTPAVDPLGNTTPTAEETHRGISRGFAAGDFVTSESKQEETCSGADCRQPKRPRLEPRSSESREGDNRSAKPPL